MNRRLINRVRGDFYFSAAASRVLQPIQRVCHATDEEIRRKVWVNGGHIAYGGIELVFPRDVGVPFATALYWNGEEGYEPEIWPLLRTLLKGASHLVDVGSNIGLYAVIAKKINPALQVDAFEPIPSIYEKNIRFHRANGLEPTRVWPFAVSDRDGNAIIYLPVDHLSIEEASAATLRADSWQSRRTDKIVKDVRTVTLDQFFATRQVGRPLVIKIDVEDFEDSVLRGARALLQSARPAIICEILTRPHGNRATADLLAECHFVPLAITRDGLFRLESSDLGQPRAFSNFLLIHEQLIPANRNFVPIANAGQLIRNG